MSTEARERKAGSTRCPVDDERDKSSSLTKETRSIAASWAPAARASASLRLYSWQTLYSGVVNLTIAAGTALVVYAGRAR